MVPACRLERFRQVGSSSNGPKHCTSCTPDAGGRNKVCKTARVTAWTTPETSDYDPATARVSRATRRVPPPTLRRVKKRTTYDVATADRCPATRQTTRATRRVPPPTPRRREETYQVRRGNGRPVPGNTPEDVGNVPRATSHSSTRPRQHRDSDLPGREILEMPEPCQLRTDLPL